MERADHFLAQDRSRGRGQELRDPGRAPRRSAERDPRSRSEEHTSELQSLRHLVCRLLLEKIWKMVMSEINKLADESALEAAKEVLIASSLIIDVDGGRYHVFFKNCDGDSPLGIALKKALRY